MMDDIVYDAAIGAAVAEGLFDITNDLLKECARQDQKWGRQDHSTHKWNSIITEELGESAEAALILDVLPIPASAANYRRELVQVAACAMQAILTLDRRAGEFDPVANKS